MTSRRAQDLLASGFVPVGSKEVPCTRVTRENDRPQVGYKPYKQPPARLVPSPVVEPVQFIPPALPKPTHLIATKPERPTGWLPVGVCAHPLCTNVREYRGYGLGYAPMCWEHLPR